MPAVCLQRACSVPAVCLQCACSVSAVCLQCACSVSAVCLQCACSVSAVCLQCACSMSAVCLQCVCSVPAVSSPKQHRLYRWTHKHRDLEMVLQGDTSSKLNPAWKLYLKHHTLLPQSYAPDVRQSQLSTLSLS